MMNTKLSKEKLIEIGVNPDNLNYLFGEMNIIVQLPGFENGKDCGKEITQLYPDIYQPRKNLVWSCQMSGDEIKFSKEEEKKDFVRHLRDSAERLKIMSYYLMQQAKEIEEIGYPKTSLYYPE